MLLATFGETVHLEKRPPSGIWGGLHCFQEFDSEAALQDHLKLQKLKVKTNTQWPSFRHTFTHYHLDITPVHVELKKQPQQIMEAGSEVWYNLRDPQSVGLAAPVKKLTKVLQDKLCFELA